MSEPAAHASIAVLLVHDDRRRLSALEAMLDGIGLDIIATSSANDALAELARRDVALILLDVRSSTATGIELASMIRAQGPARRVPLMLVTAYDPDEELLERVREVGPFDVLSEPPVPEVLRSKVLGWLELHRRIKDVDDRPEHALAELRASVEASTLRSEMAASKRINERLQLLAGVAGQLLGRADPFGVVDIVAARFVERLGYDVCVCYRLHEADRRLCLVSAAGTEGLSWHHPWIEIDDTPVMRAVFDDRTRYIREAPDNEQRPPWLHDLGLPAHAVFPIVRGGSTIGVLVVGRRSTAGFAPEDIAAIQLMCDQVALADERDHLIGELRRHADEMAEADRRKDDFLAMLGHELRSPLAPMRHALDLLRRREEEPAAAALREVLERQVSHMARMVDDLLDVSRIRSGKLELSVAPTAIQDVIRDALERSRPNIDGRGHRVDVDLPDRDLVVHGDAIRLVQAIGNLLDNAARYTDPGGHILVRGHRRGGDAVIHVRDDGRGIPPNKLRAVFEMFVQAAHPGEHVEGGLGLGLALVRQLVALHGGTVWAESEGLGRGSEFTIVLPLAGPRTAPDPRTVEGRPRAATGRVSAERRDAGFRILVVEDDEDSRDMLQRQLEARGHRIEVATDGASGLTRLLAERHDVAFIDIGLPDVDGYEVARLVRERWPEGTPRLIALTGHGKREDRERALAAGFDEHLVKPVTIEELERLLVGRR